jgi:pre-mRNA-splicing helicase BRR2
MPKLFLGTIQTIDEAVGGLTHSSIFACFKISRYIGIANPEQTLKEDPTLEASPYDLAHTAASMLEKSHLVRYDRKVGFATSYPLVVCRESILHIMSMAVYSRHMRPTCSISNYLPLFHEWGVCHITVREEEKLELSKLAGKVPIPVKESLRNQVGEGEYPLQGVHISTSGF